MTSESKERPRPRGATTVQRFKADLRLAGGTVPSILLIPDAAEPVAAALLLHGYASSKELLSDTIGRALAARGMASLAIDLPLHGTRDDALIAQARANPMELVKHFRNALAEAKAAVAVMAAHEAIDEHRIAAVGYSLGSYVALMTAAKETRIQAVVVAAGGDLPATPWTRMARLAADPISAVKSLKSRPLLMLHGRNDPTIPPESAQRLYDAARDPKELFWYDGGHALPASAADHAAEWLLARLG